MSNSEINTEQTNATTENDSNKVEYYEGLPVLSAKAIKEILDRHELWIISKGEEGECANFSYKALRKVRLNSKDLTNAHFIGSVLEEVEFRDCNLENAEFIGARMNNVYLASCYLCEASFIRATMNACSFNDSDLSGAYFNHTEVADSTFEGADTANVRWYGAVINAAEGHIVGLSRQGIQYRYVILDGENNRAIIGCFDGTFEAAKERIIEKYGKDAYNLHKGYGYTLAVMEILKQTYHPEKCKPGIRRKLVNIIERILFLPTSKIRV